MRPPSLGLWVRIQPGGSQLLWIPTNLSVVCVLLVVVGCMGTAVRLLLGLEMEICLRSSLQVDAAAPAVAHPDPPRGCCCFKAMKRAENGPKPFFSPSSSSQELGSGSVNLEGCSGAWRCHGCSISASELPAHVHKEPPVMVSCL